MSKIFENDSDSEIDIKVDNEYAKSYSTWRKKEELNKLKTKYGDDVLEEESSSSSDDDEEGAELTEEVEKQFFKTLSYLKNKDPRIYDDSVKFFDVDGTKSVGTAKVKKEKPMFLNDYERELLLKTNGKLDSDEENSQPSSPTYIQEQNKLKENFKNALNQVEDDDNEGWGGMLKVRHKTEEEKVKEEVDYKEWLAGQKKDIDDKEVERELKPLKDYWNNPNLDSGEKFLRDYILHKRFLGNEDENYIPTYDEIVHDSDRDLSEDENAIERQEEFEHKYNFRFEEPDQDFIKRYPRTVEQSLRKTDDRRKIKRAETKERKQKEKEEKMQDLKKLQEFKRKEIEEKIQRLKEITGNDDLEFKDDDLEGDFDPDAHDRKMQQMFNDEFYEGEEGEQKPEFPEIDEYLELENWEKWKGEETGQNGDNDDERAPHCEDENFNMDCDYDPNADFKKELIENSKGKKKRKRKSLFAKAVSQPKPVFDPNDKTYEEYLDEYYKFDCEDIIGDIPCKFKYRKVVPNTFGLSIEEILTANDRELNKWCSLKKAVQHRPDHMEKYDQIAYQKKASNLDLKKRILPSLFAKEEKEDKQETEDKKKKKKVRCKKGVAIDEEEVVKTEQIHKTKKKKTKTVATITSTDQSTQNENTTNIETEASEKVEAVPDQKKKKKKNKKKNKQKAADTENTTSDKVNKKRKLSERQNEDKPKKKIKKTSKTIEVGMSDARLSAYGINPKKFKNKLKYGES